VGHIENVTAGSGGTHRSEDSRGRRASRMALALALAVLLVAGCFILLGLLLTRVVEGSALVTGEAELSRDLAAGRTPGWNTLTQVFTWLAATPTVLILAAIAVVVLGKVLGRSREAVYVAACVAGETAAFLLVTLVVDRPRPPVGHLDEAPPTSAFPSGHTAASVVLYGSIAVLAWRLVTPRLVRLAATSAAVVVPVLVAASRLYRGMHFPTDVAAGALLGLTWLGTVAYVLLPKRPQASSGGDRLGPGSTPGQAARRPG